MEERGKMRTAAAAAAAMACCNGRAGQRIQEGRGSNPRASCLVRVGWMSRSTSSPSTTTDFWFGLGRRFSVSWRSEAFPTRKIGENREPESEKRGAAK